jgi:Response regulator containing a CheY-like receiver domain and an HTH DNA-binding domain
MLHCSEGDGMERQIRVLVANRPKLMREIIIETFADQPDIAIVGEVAEDGDILGQVDETQPDFLFIALDDPDKRPSVCDAILRLHPKVRIIAVAANSNRTVKYWASFNIHRTVIEASEEAILGVIRGSATREVS